MRRSASRSRDEELGLREARAAAAAPPSFPQAATPSNMENPSASIQMNERAGSLPYKARSEAQLSPKSQLSYREAQSRRLAADLQDEDKEPFISLNQFVPWSTFPLPKMPPLVPEKAETVLHLQPPSDGFRDTATASKKFIFSPAFCFSLLHNKSLVFFLPRFLPERSFDLNQGGMGSPRVQLFFKVLLPGFLEKLSIPYDFAAENLPQTDSPKKVSILGPLRKFWHIQIKREGCTLYFTDGWREFAEAHDLAVGFFLVFRYQGNMVFIIQVYGLNGCLKDYNNAGRRYLSMSLARSYDEEEQQLVEDENDYFIEEKEEDDIMVEDSPLQLASGTEPPLQFEKKIRPYNLKYKIMGIPRHLSSRSEFNTDQVFLLKDMRGRSWRVNYHQNGKDGFLRSGWDVFSKNNNLELGDRCIFKFISKGLMDVEVVKYQKYLLGY